MSKTQQRPRLCSAENSQFVLVTGGRIWHCFLPPMTHQIHAPVKKRLFSLCADDARLLRASRSDTFISIVFRMLVSTGRSARSYLSCSHTMKHPRTLHFRAFFGTWDTILGILDGPSTALWRLMVRSSRKATTFAQSG